MHTHEPDLHLWKTAVQRIRERSPASFDAWFSGVQYDGFRDGTLALRARDEFVRDWVSEHFQPALLDTLAELSGQHYLVEWTLDPALQQPVSCAKPPAPVLPRAIHVLRDEQEPAFDPEVQEPRTAVRKIEPLVGVNPKNTFANFVVG
ncbi:MAG: chromosomal replication initiator protein DnaA, partial [Polyangiaceae bacterium]|nr:chromosomal replication initiator protein DnaA [Polyangiaceae bacterium]